MEKFILNFIRVTGCFTTIVTLILLFCLVSGSWEWSNLHPVRACSIVFMCLGYCTCYLLVELAYTDEEE